MNQVAIRQQGIARNEDNRQKLMLLDYMADKYSLTAEQFRATVRATCGLGTATSEQVAAFLIVAKEYDLNPLLKEIYAFPGRGGGIVPIVSIDGWVNLVNSHPQCDGFDFVTENDESGLFAITCTMHRKDRKHPTVVTEYLSECIRSTDPWKMKHRMLRHKSFIQAARYAFGFAGIYDEDEGRVIADSGDVAPIERTRVPSPTEVIEVQPEVKEDPITSGPAPKKSTLPDFTKDYDSWISVAFLKIADASDGGSLETFWQEEIEPRAKDIFPSDFTDLSSRYGTKQTALNADG